MGYTVQPGDSWAKIAEKLYGDQRMLGELQRGNRNIGMLQPGMTLSSPEKKRDPVVTTAELKTDVRVDGETVRGINPHSVLGEYLNEAGLTVRQQIADPLAGVVADPVDIDALPQGMFARDRFVAERKAMEQEQLAQDVTRGTGAAAEDMARALQQAQTARAARELPGAGFQLPTLGIREQVGAPVAAAKPDEPGLFTKVLAGYAVLPTAMKLAGAAVVDPDITLGQAFQVSPGEMYQRFLTELRGEVAPPSADEIMVDMPVVGEVSLSTANWMKATALRKTAEAIFYYNGGYTLGSTEAKGTGGKLTPYDDKETMDRLRGDRSILPDNISAETMVELAAHAGVSVEEWKDAYHYSWDKSAYQGRGTWIKDDYVVPVYTGPIYSGGRTASRPRTARSGGAPSSRYTGGYGVTQTAFNWRIRIT